MKKFILKQINDIKTYGVKEFFRKLSLLFKITLKIPVDLIAIVLCIIIRLLSPLVIIRIEKVPSLHFGSLANDLAIYYCKKKLKIGQLSKRHIDLVYIDYNNKIYNKQLVKMWKRKLNFISGYFLDPINRANRLFPGWQAYSIPDITSVVSGDLYSSIEKCQPLDFTREEEIYGKNLLNKFGLKDGDKFVCFTIRDGAYQLKKISSRYRDWSYHDYRHWNSDNFLLAAEELTKKGYYVFRMGVVADKLFKSDNPKIIDYVNSSLRNDFMDVFLGAKCSFCLSSSSGYEEVSHIFRKPIIFLAIPFGDFRSYTEKYLVLTKHHYLKKENRRLTLSEIFSHGVAFAYDTKIFDQKGIELIDNTPEEIKDVAIEMTELLEQKNKLNDEEEILQKTFKDLYLHNYKIALKSMKDNNEKKLQKTSVVFSKMHGQIRSRFSTKFLKDNKSWLS